MEKPMVVRPQHTPLISKVMLLVLLATVCFVLWNLPYRTNLCVPIYWSLCCCWLGFYGTDEETLCYDLAKELAADASMVTQINVLGAVLGKDSLRKKGRNGPDIDIAGMFAWGMDSAVRGCSPKQCPVTDAGIATGLFDKDTTKFVAHQCPDEDKASSASTVVVSMVAAVCSTVAVMVALWINV